MKSMKDRIRKGIPTSLGVTKHCDGLNFAISIPNEKECLLKISHRETGDVAVSFLLTSEYKTGNIFSCKLPVPDKKNNKETQIIGEIIENPEEYTYLYEVKGRDLIDPYARSIVGKETYGELKDVTSVVLPHDYQWKDDIHPEIPYSQLIVYHLHLRGFTKHPSSKVQYPGTFNGLTEKIPYLKTLGINCILLMPIYEYKETLPIKGIGKIGTKINYWGYSDENYYFSPKASYAADPVQAGNELKDMIWKLHQVKIEVIMEMYFPYGTNHNLILDCLKYWVMEYHVDGFHLIGDTIPKTTIAMEPLLSNTKLLASSWDLTQIYDKGFVPTFKNLAEYHEGYSVDIKGYLRGDEGKVSSFASRFKYNPEKCGVINYITNHDGFTLMDLYSYDVKHNEGNGELNRDGRDYNYSWNCGKEGKTKDKKVLNIRRKQIRNAFTLLLLSQGTPMILAGDEFGNTQYGNNNPYCQDNEITWLNWGDLDSNKDIFEYVQMLISIRKCHPILHMEYPLKSLDYISSGYPDLSFHGTKAWYPDYSFYSRMLGIMLSGQYAKINQTDNDVSIYIACNMHWQTHTFDLPSLPRNMKWHVLLDTKKDKVGDEKEIQPCSNQKEYKVDDRSIVVFIGK